MVRDGGERSKVDWLYTGGNQGADISPPRSDRNSLNQFDVRIPRCRSLLDNTAPFSRISFGSFGASGQVSHTHLNERGRADHMRLARVGHPDVVRRTVGGGTSK